MSHLVSTDMSHDEFMEMIDNYIERSSHQTGEMPASAFLEHLFSTSKKRVQETFPLGARVVEGKLQFMLPTDREHTLQARGNEILVGDQLIVVTLDNPCGMTNGANAPKVTVPIRLEPDILEWFQAQGDKCQQRINAALRLYVEAHREFSLKPPVLRKQS